MRRLLALLVAIVLPAALGSTSMSCAPDVSGAAGTGGGSAASGGARAATGGSTSAGSGGQVGETGSGGAPAQSTGGSSSTGGNPGRSGGAVGSTGGAVGPGTGGRGGSGSGGRGGSGGSTGGSGGGTATGGNRGTATGGMSATGGVSATGGRGTGGAGTGGAGTGGSGPTACNLPNHSGSGSFTYYYFGQGTAKDGNGFRTACGYYGTESGTTDTIQNIASMSPASATYFAAIPGTSGFNTSSKCGSCVQITGQNGKVIIATVADECPYGSDGGNALCGANPGGHLDLSKAAFDQLGYSRGDPTGTTWKFVPCPVTGNIVVRVKPGNPNELFVENTILAITGVQGASKTSYGAWHFNGNLAAGQSIQLTDALNRTLTIQLGNTNAGSNQDTGKQFPACQ